MKLTFKKLFQVGLFFTALMLCFFGFTHSDHVVPTYLALYTLGLAHHLIFDAKKSKLFISVFILFIISSGFEVYFSFNRLQGTSGAFTYLYTVQLFWMLGFILLFLRLLKEHSPRFKFHKWTFLILFIIALDVFFAVKILNMIDAFQLSSHHIIYSFLFTILKMTITSVGLIYFIIAGGHSRRIGFLTAVFFCIFLSDITGAFNSLIFYENNLSSFTLLELGLFCISLVFIYIYCTSSKLVDVLEKERFI